MTTQRISLTVNGEAREADVEPRLLLVHLLRDGFGLTGTHVGCDTSNCGACTVHIDGQSAKSCTMLAVPAAGVLGPARPPVRLLHAGDDHAVGLALGPEPGADGRGGPRGHQRQPVPLHGL